MSDLLTRINRFPPALCRLVARKNRGRRMMSAPDIVARSGLSLRQVSYMSVSPNWNPFTAESVSAFARGCGVDLLHTRQHIDWLARRPKSAWKGREKFVTKLLRLTAARKD